MLSDHQNGIPLFHFERLSENSYFDKLSTGFSPIHTSRAQGRKRENEMSW